MHSRYPSKLRFASLVVLFFFVWSFGGLRDAALAAKEGLDTPALKRERLRDEISRRGDRPEEKLEKAVGEVEKLVRGFGGKKSKEERQAEKARLKEHSAAIDIEVVELRQQFDATEQLLIDKKLPPEKLQAHREFVKEYESEQAELNTHLQAVAAASTDADEDREVADFQAYIKRVKVEKKRPKIDFNHLPHRNAEPTQLKPRLHKEEFETVQKAELIPADQAFVMLHPGQDLGKDGYHPVRKNEPFRVASVGPMTGLLPAEQIADFTPPSLEAQASTMLLAAASDLPKPEDLAETIEVQLTPAIRAKAAGLGNNPRKIYEWVRNNVEFAPTWGSIQGADYCMQTMVCNSFDTSSLLIALLRAANVPARYVQGTIELPIDKTMNWAGDFTDANAALQFMSAGGIPTGAVVEGGKISRAHLEQVWVEAWIDYIPGRGYNSLPGKGDRWIPLDASFKQHTYTSGLDIAAAVPFDAQTFVNQLNATANINEQQGYVTGIDSAMVQQTMADFQSRVESYITTNHPNATVGDVLGSKNIKAETYSYLLGTLPYKRVVTGSKYANLPDILRHRWSMNIEGVAPITYTATLPELAGKKITLSYAPATAADEAVIASYLPAPHADGTPIDPSELPSSLPAYLIKLKPELRIDGVVVTSGGPVMMGSTEDFYMNFYFPGKGTTPIQNTIEAGDYAGIALDLGRISQQQLAGVKTKLEATKAKLEAQDFAGLGKDDLLGDLLSATALAYYAEYDVMDYVAGRIMLVNNLRAPSEAMFSNDLKISRSFFSGRPLAASPGGLVMDVDFNTVVARDSGGNHGKMINFMRSSGVTSSSLEHAVPEQMFSTPDAPAEGVSAVKALQIANDKGIPIYTVTSANINSILPQLQVDEEVINDIVNAVAAGNEVTVSKSNIDLNGWNGCGYIVFNPDTGSGVYMISGKLNGMFMKNLNACMEKLIFLSCLTRIGQVSALLVCALYASVIELKLFLRWTFNSPDARDTRVMMCNILTALASGIIQTISLIPSQVSAAIGITELFMIIIKSPNPCSAIS